MVAEGNIGLTSHIKSTWSGDKPSNRNSAEVGPYAVYRINDDWEYEFYVAGFWQGWDRLVGMKIIPVELIYDKWLKFGVGVSIFPFGLSSAYKGIKASSLTTPFGFIQVDAGPLLVRPVKASSNSARVIPLEKTPQTQGNMADAGVVLPASTQ